MQLSLFEPSHGVSQEAPFTLRGHIQRVISFDDVTGECVLDVRTHDGLALIVESRVASVWAGQSVFGNPSDDGGAENLLFGEPPTPRLLKKFLKSGAFGVLGKKTVEILSDAFPGEFLEVLASDPRRLLEVNGIGERRLCEIISRYERFLEHARVRKFLFQEELPLHWSISSLDAFTAQPYSFVLSHGFEFEHVDRFALVNGFSMSSPERIQAGLRSLILNETMRGHCATPDEKLLDEAVSRLRVPRDVVEDALELALVREHLVADEIGGTPVIYSAETWKLERIVSERLLAIFETPPRHPSINPAKSVAWAQRFLEIQLSDLQRKAVETAVSSSLAVITGGPGTGKTTLVRCLVTILNAQQSGYALCAPTGRAAQRLRETTGAQATTIHRLLKHDGARFTHSRENPLDVDFVLVDEASMIDLALMSALLEALPDGCALVLVGDANQLPSVGAGTVLQSLISAERFPVVHLTDMFRQSADSGIRLNAERIHKGLMPINGGARKNDFRYIPLTNAREQIDQIVREVLPREFGIRDTSRVQILTPTNRGELGAACLNEDLRDLFTNAESSGHVRYRVGDKVIVSRNDYAKNVFNGDIGRVSRASHEILEVDFGDRAVIFRFDELDSLSLAYAISIHKSQGSEYSAVIVILTEEHISLAQRHLVYTAVTRGKEAVFLLAEPRALRRAIEKAETRWQKLTELLRL